MNLGLIAYYTPHVIGGACLAVLVCTILLVT
jgi:hypothetical protein